MSVELMWLCDGCSCTWELPAREVSRVVAAYVPDGWVIWSQAGEQRTFCGDCMQDGTAAAVGGA